MLSIAVGVLIWGYAVQAIGRVGPSADAIHSVHRAASLIRTVWVVVALAVASSGGTQAASAQATGAIAQLMPLLSEEEEELERARSESLLRQIKAAGQLPEDLANAGRPTKEERRPLRLGPMIEALQSDYPGARTIPEGKIIEVGVSVRLPGGKTIGPYRMYSSLAPGHTEYEFANGLDYGVPSKPWSPANGGLPDFKNLDLSDMMFFKADGDERLIGAVLGNVGPDGTIEMNFALIVDGQPMRIVRAAARSGESAQVNAPGGHLFTIRPVLRNQTKVEARWNGLAKQEMAIVDPHSHYPPSLKRINPEWPGPIYVRTGPLYLRALASAQIVCGEWKSRFSNDPAVDASGLGASPVTVTFDAEGKPQISVPSPPGAFAADVFPGGLASTQTADKQMWPTGFNHLGRSPTLADVLDFNDLEQASPSVSWERIRRDDGIIYRTRFFLRCRKQGS